MCSAPPSVVEAVTVPRTSQYRLGFDGSDTVTETRGSRSMFRTFW